MKLRIIWGSILWTVMITLLHIWANIGFRQFGQDVRVWAGIERAGLRVGYLPVT